MLDILSWGLLDSCNNRPLAGVLAGLLQALCTWLAYEHVRIRAILPVADRKAGLKAFKMYAVFLAEYKFC